MTNDERQQVLNALIGIETDNLPDMLDRLDRITRYLKRVDQRHVENSDPIFGI